MDPDSNPIQSRETIPRPPETSSHKATRGITPDSPVSPQHDPLAQLNSEELSAVNARLYDVEEQVIQTWETIGSLRGRRDHSARICELEEEYAIYLEQHKDLFEQFPALGPALLERQQEAEQEGIDRYVRCDRAAIKLHQATHWSQRDSTVAHQTLAHHTPEERTLIRECFYERYEKEIDQAFQEAFVRDLPQWKKIPRYIREGRIGDALTEPLKLRNLFRIREALTLMRDLYGYQAGIFTLVVDGIKNRRLKDAGVLATMQKLLDAPEASRTQALLREDRVTVASDSMFIALKRDVDPPRSLALLFEDLSRKEILGAEIDFNRRYRSRMGGRTLQAVLRDRFEGEELEYLLALKSKDHVQAHAVLVHQAIYDKRIRLEACKKVLALSEKDTIALRVSFEKTYGSALSEDHPDLNTGKPYVDVLRELLHGHNMTAAALRLNWALKQRKAEWPGDVFYEHTGEQNTAIIHEYERITGKDFWREARKKVKGDRIKILRSLVDNGELTTAEQLRDCMQGFGADSKSILMILADPNNNDPDQLKRDYRERFQRDLDRDLRWELFGNDRFDAQLLRQGPPKNLHELVGRVHLMRKHAHNRITGFFLDRFTEDGRRLRSDFTALEDFFSKHIEGKEPTREQQERCKVLAQLCMQDVKEIRNLKAAIANVAVNTTTLAGLIIVPQVVVSGPLLTITQYKRVASATFLTSLALRIGLKSAIKGSGYSKREMGIDLTLAGVDGGFCFLNKLRLVRYLHLNKVFTNPKTARIATQIARAAIKIGLKKTLKGGVTSTWELADSRVSSHVLNTQRLRELEKEQMRGKRLAHVVLRGKFST